MPNDPHHTPTIIPPSTSQPQRKQSPRKPKRNDTEIPQSSVPVENVADEAVYEERDDSLERATTTATTLDAEQDRGNISNTQSKATPNQPSSIRTSLGGGPRDQDTMGDTIAQTRSKNLSKFSNDLLLVGVTTPRSGEDSVQLKELMDFYDEASLGDQEDASKHGRKIHDINADEDITLENVHDADMFGMHDLDGDEDEVETDYELAQRLQAEEQEELTIVEKSKLFQQLLEKRRKHFAAKRAEEKRNRPPTKAQQRSIMCIYLKNIAGWKPKYLKTKSFANVQELFDKAMKRVNIFVDMNTKLVEGTKKEKSSKKADVEISQESSSKRA
ncbi:hypothetical protein Tco_0588591, partial [Tanacetum coccineum]